VSSTGASGGESAGASGGESAEQVPLRDAATVVLLRDGADGPEAFLLTRVREMAFAAGMTVFPGGRVEESDAALPMTGADTAALAVRFGCPEPTARALLGAAARETFEETGVLLTVPAPTSTADELAVARTEVEAGRLAFAELLADEGLAVDAAALRPWSRWVTPAGEVRRYDTRFFVGALPPGSEALHVTGEASASAWVPVGAAVERAQRGELALLPPTMTTLASLLEYGTVAQVLEASAEQSLEPVRPELLVGADGSVSVALPGGRLMPIPRSMLP
jgi:8-oxo-dGTP pyrophosphatase MutT (NUDIX family)